MSQSALEVLQEGASFLRNQGFRDAASSSGELLAHILKKPRWSLYADSGTPVCRQKRSDFFELVKKRSMHMPLQYLVGRVPFRWADLEVGKGTFIPRPETECVVDVVMERLIESPCGHPRILDVGTGTGCIAISLAMEIPQASIVATDQSAKSIRLALKNAASNGVQDRIQFVRTHYWRGISDAFDFVVSNPPYLSKTDFLKLQSEVRFEPKKALDGGRDGLRSYRHIIRSIKPRLSARGVLIFEVGMGQRQAVEMLLEENGFFDIRSTKDLAGIDRVISAKVD